MRRLLCRAGIALAIAAGATAGVSGVAGAQGTVDYTTRTVSARAKATFPDGVDRITSFAAINGTLDVHALPTAPYYYVFRLFVQPDSVFAAGVSSAQFGGPSVVADATAQSDGFEYEEGRLADGTSTGTHDFGPGMFNRIRSYPPGSPATYLISATAWVQLSAQGQGSSASASSSMTLLGADAYSAQSVLLGSAVFDSFGNGSFATTAPEPSSLALLGMGLLGLVPMVRRRNTIS